MAFKYLSLKKKIYSHEKHLLESIDSSFNKVNLVDLFKKNIKIGEDYTTIIKKKIKNFDNKKIYVIAFGKMASVMIGSIAKILNKKKHISYLQISNTLNYKVLKKVKSFKSQHPVPGNLSLNATRKLIDHLKKTEMNSIIIFLISGGGSSMITYPIKGISLNKKKKLTMKLFSLNTQPKYLNYYRMALSRVKNGGLLKYIKTKYIFNFFISDENEDKIEVLSSGPTVNRQSRLQKEILNYFKNNSTAKKLVNKNDFKKIIKNIKNKKINKKTKNIILLKNFDFIKILKNEIKKKLNVEVFASKKFLFGDYEKNLEKIEKILKIVENKKKKFIYIFGAQIETPMEAKSEKKLGGRLQHITADLLLRNKLKKIKIASLATDSQDYNRKVFGTLIDFSKKINKNKINHYLKYKITKKFHQMNKSLILSKKNSNLNLKDIFIIYNF